MLINQLKTIINDPNLEKVETVQMLWSDYGEIARYFSPLNNKHFIIKHIDVPEDIEHPRGWNTPLSHQRKLNSYQIEKSFYQDYANLCPEACKVATPIASLVSDEQLVIVMEDLDYAGYFNRVVDADMKQIKSVIHWLANFHGYFFNHDGQGLWQQGCYWHLGTRPDELKAMAAGRLKDNASAIDQKLNDAKYKTLVHGDAKLANFCFSQDFNKVVGVDFQYIGSGVGVQDLAYFLGSCLDSKDLHLHHNELLEEYFSTLKLALKRYHRGVRAQQVINEWQGLYAFAWADFYRFLQGWSPSHFKINAYMHKQTDLALAQLQKAK
ncbi:oxidoreductase family protein [Thalassomonas sp. M1454]|uniref:oxidoreductase family protein n=1 Tax=Thalassomonas sp. M1454 TaxID=2594477 RepID=UPI00117D0E15|nr:oxidoreductase family protein [Thalassomonas sp. M1454]TRX54469.1 DUF1679 domain-containing protein [Thalassomonas sp. M1454]